MWLPGFVALVILWIVSGVITRNPNPFAMAKGDNGNISTSQLQVFVFTGVTLFAYSSATWARLAGTGPITLPGIPVNLMLVMGLSATTAASAKGITLSYLKQDKLPIEDQSSWSAGRDGRTDLTKVQMIAWTVIAVIVYAFQLKEFMGTSGNVPAAAIPDVDGALMVLMGVANGSYVAGKLVASAGGVPITEDVKLETAGAGKEIKVKGAFFGSDRGNSLVTLTDRAKKEIQLPVTSWSDNEISAPLPATAAAGDYELTVVRFLPAKTEPRRVTIS